jgi:uncharacterized LabA/DUF88 family protein
MKSERVRIFIDGGNTYKALFKGASIRIPSLVAKGKKFSYKDFATSVAAGREITGMSYYVGVVRDHDHTDKSRDMVIGQQKFLSHLENDCFLVERGKIVYDHNIREKGVDVKMAIDLVIGAMEDTYDTAILLSSDTDLVPAIKYIQSKGKKVEYIGFSNSASFGLIKECDTQRVFGVADLTPFIS